MNLQVLSNPAAFKIFVLTRPGDSNFLVFQVYKLSAYVTVFSARIHSKLDAVIKLIHTVNVDRINIDDVTVRVTSLDRLECKTSTANDSCEINLDCNNISKNSSIVEEDVDPTKILNSASYFKVANSFPS